MTAVFPRDIPDPRQRGIVTRYSSLTAWDIQALMASPSMTTWATSKSLTTTDLANLATALGNALGQGGRLPTGG